MGAQWCSVSASHLSHQMEMVYMGSVLARQSRGGVTLLDGEEEEVFVCVCLCGFICQ